MKNFIIPIGLAVLAAVIIRMVNPAVETPGIVMIAALGLGIGYALVNTLFKGKKSTETAETEEKEKALPHE